MAGIWFISFLSFVWFDERYKETTRQMDCLWGEALGPRPKLALYLRNETAERKGRL